jgi:hypothetical protein
MIYVTGKII